MLAAGIIRGRFNINLFKKRYLWSFFSKSSISLSIIRIFLIVISIFNMVVSIISQLYMEISLYRNRIARKGKNRCCEILFQTAFYLNIYFILFFTVFFKLGTQFVMYYKLRCNSTQFVIYYKLRNYYKLQRNKPCENFRFNFGWTPSYQEIHCLAKSHPQWFTSSNVKRVRKYEKFEFITFLVDF